MSEGWRLLQPEMHDNLYFPLNYISAETNNGQWGGGGGGCSGGGGGEGLWCV